MDIDLSPAEENLKVCCICQDTNRPLSEKEINAKITDRGLESLVSASEIRQDEIGMRIMALVENGKSSDIRFHRICRSNYTHKQKIESFNNPRKRKSLELPETREDIEHETIELKKRVT